MSCLMVKYLNSSSDWKYYPRRAEDIALPVVPLFYVLSA
jgi:hypothetical protein